MAVPYERAILIAIMRAIAVNPNINVKSLDLPTETGKGSTETFTVTRDMIPRTDMSEDEKRDVEMYRAASAVRNLNFQQIIDICKVLADRCAAKSHMIFMVAYMPIHAPILLRACLGL
jgi:hypothetical protein